MSLEHFFVYLVEVSMLILGSVMLWTHTKKKSLLALFVLLSITTAAMGSIMNYAAHKTIPFIMIYTIVAVEYSMVQMDRRIDALISTGVKSVKPPYKLILFILVVLSGVVGGLLTSPPSAMQSHIELVIAIVLIAVALVSRIIRILLRGYQATPKENL
jgi:membrane protein DedA with SNARE-associated domain